MTTLEAVTTDWTVYDSNQRGEAPRIHEVGSKRYALFADKPCPMPMQHAVVFLRDPAFVVINPAGDQQVSLPDAENLDAAKPRPQLEPGETIAKFEELTDPALRARAALRPGGHLFNEDTQREALVEFLNGTPAIGELPERLKPRGTGGAPENPGDDLSPDEAKRLLEGA